MTKNRRELMADPFGGSDEESSGLPKLSMSDADAALFGELSRREVVRQTVRGVSVFNVFPDVKQPRRAVPLEVRKNWNSNRIQDIADLFTNWLAIINTERGGSGLPPFNIDDFLWAENIEGKSTEEESIEVGISEAGPIERSFLRLVDLAMSIRRDGLVNPITVQRVGSDSYRLETGERRWLAYHLLFAYFNGDANKPDEREKWEFVPASIVDDFDVWRQASENAARADLNAVGRARQFAILMMDLLSEQGHRFEQYEAMAQAGHSDRAYYAQVIPHRVPSGKGEMLSNGLGVSHRAAFTRCRTILGLPDEIWDIGDKLDWPEDELLRLAKIEPVETAIKEAARSAQNVASRNISAATTSKKKSSKAPTLFTDPACKHGKRLFSAQNEQVVRELLRLKDGVGQARPSTKQAIKTQINEVRQWLNQLEQMLDKGGTD